MERFVRSLSKRLRNSAPRDERGVAHGAIEVL